MFKNPQSKPNRLFKKQYKIKKKITVILTSKQIVCKVIRIILIKEYLLKETKPAVIVPYTVKPIKLNNKINWNLILTEESTLLVSQQR